MTPERSRLLPAAIIATVLLGWAAVLMVSRAIANQFNLVVYVAANLIVFLDFLDFALRLYFRRIGAATGDTSIPVGARGLTPYQKQLHLRPYALAVSVHNLGERLDSFLESLQPYRSHVWVIDDASIDGTPVRLRHAGWRCLAGAKNQNKPGAIQTLLASLPSEIETVMVIDPDIVIRDTRAGELSDLEEVIFDFQLSGLAAMCPRIVIKRDGLLGRFQSFEYAMSFALGRCSLGDRSITSGISIYRRSALQATLDRHSLSVYGEDLENAVILLGSGQQIYYDGRLVVETEGPPDWQRWFSQRVGWSYGLIRVYLERFGDLWRAAGGRFIAAYQYLVYLGILCLALHPLKCVGWVLLALSLLNGLDGLFGLDAMPDLPINEPIYFVAAFVKYSILAFAAFFVAVPRGDRMYVLPIVPLYSLYSLLQVIPVTIGYANWISLRIWGKRVYRDHYQDEASLTRRHIARGEEARVRP